MDKTTTDKYEKWLHYTTLAESHFYSDSDFDDGQDYDEKFEGFAEHRSSPSSLHAGGEDHAESKVSQSSETNARATAIRSTRR